MLSTESVVADVGVETTELDDGTSELVLDSIDDTADETAVLRSVSVSPAVDEAPPLSASDSPLFILSSSPPPVVWAAPEDGDDACPPPFPLPPAVELARVVGLVEGELLPPPAVEDAPVTADLDTPNEALVDDDAVCWRATRAMRLCSSGWPCCCWWTWRASPCCA